MNKLNHEFFGELDLVNGVDDGLGIDFGDGIMVLWEEEFNNVNTTLWYGKEVELSEKLLDKFADFLKNFNKYHQLSVKALVAYLEKDNEYIDFHKNEIEMDVPEEPSAFVEAMVVNNIGLWADGDNTIIVDYMIDPEESDEILAIKFDENLEIVDISWES